MDLQKGNEENQPFVPVPVSGGNQVYDEICASFGLGVRQRDIDRRLRRRHGLCLESIRRTGKKAPLCHPTFGMYKVYADMQQMHTEFVHYEDDYSFDVNKLVQKIDNDTGIVSLVNPNMPIGNTYADEEIERVVEKAKSVGAMVIIDEAYHYFYDRPALDLIDKYDNVVILRTFSKFFSIPGLRLGVVISSKQNIQYIKNYKPHYTVNNMALVFGETIVDNFGRLHSELEKKFSLGKSFLLKQLELHGYSFIPTDGCFICIRPKHKTPEHITEQLKKYNILIFCGKGDSAGFLRVTIWAKKYMKLFMNALLEIDKKD